jgi:predicted glycosyltransferase
VKLMDLNGAHPERRTARHGPEDRAASLAKPRVALYSHDAMGIGHMRRNVLIARALAGAPLYATVLLIAGAREAGLFPLADGLDYLTLPALAKDLNGLYRPRSLHVELSDLLTLRSELIHAAIQTFQPDLFIVDKLPRGIAGELDKTLHAVARSRTRCVLGLRDVLDEPAVVKAEWRQGRNEAVVDEAFAAVWIYGDRTIYDPVREYGFTARVARKVRYSGYFDQHARIEYVEASQSPDPLAGLDLPEGRLVLCMLGGGQDGARLADTFSRAAFPADVNAILVAGPFLPRETSVEIRRRTADNARFRVLDFVAEPELLFSRAERIVAMGGYNTVCEILSFEKPALIVPRVSPRREQLIRAVRLSALGLLDLLHPDEATPARIADWVAADVPPPSARDRIDFNGLERIPAFACDVLAALNPAVAVPTASEEFDSVAS